ncbi:class I SAM-dependent methyltransferase [Billgrantia sp. LNSP4103-1]|uniref:class I SAM-dependent methyltransferase n=1 Tax=Billgrantia sp. LNSP4103-1 TaxID=3410266 RepID=UPI00403F5CFF
MPHERTEPSLGEYGDKLADHYDAATAREGKALLPRAKEAFHAAGCDPVNLTLDDVAGIDQLHLGGRSASRSLARMAGLQGGERVLDVGCGTGGAGRLLAAEFGCEVIGIDLTAAFVEVADWLSGATGLAERTHFLCADAARLPLAANSIDLVWCQHALMNMPHLPRVLAEWQRLLRPEGRVLLHEVVAGDNREPLSLPVPWARSHATSHLRDREQLLRAMALAGFEPFAVEDVTEAALAWRKERSRRECRAGEKRQVTPPLPGPGLIFGAEFAQMGRNLRDNLAAGKVRVLQGGWRRVQR